MAEFQNETTPFAKPIIPKPITTQDETISHKVGDQIERIGEKLKNVGADKIGSAVYKAGNKLEHRSDGENGK